MTSGGCAGTAMHFAGGNPFRQQQPQRCSAFSGGLGGRTEAAGCRPLQAYVALTDSIDPAHDGGMQAHASPCNGQRAADNVQQTTCNRQRATGNMQQTLCNRQHAAV